MSMIRPQSLALAVLGSMTFSSIAIGQGLPLPYTEEDRFAFDFPVACVIGEDCIIQNYVDVDATRRYKDHNCRGLTYEGHRGTDIRIPDLEAMREGVNVLAAAEGRVKAIRSDQDDGAFAGGDASAADKPCGNAIMVQHEDGYITQYCHLKKGSLRVVRGQKVDGGQKIAEVGMSGDALYPHLHFEVRKNESTVDPYTGLLASEGCEVVRETLWKIVALPQTEYARASVLNTGVTTATVTNAGIENGAYLDKIPEPSSERISVYIRTVGLRDGDIEEIKLLGPEGVQLAQKQARYEGRRQNDNILTLDVDRPGETWPIGSYEVIYTMVRYGTPLVDKRLRLAIPSDYVAPDNAGAPAEGASDSEQDEFFIPPPPSLDRELPRSNRD